MHALALAAAILAAPAPAPAPQLVVLDGNQQVVVPRAEPKLPSDQELAQVRVDPELVRLARELDAQAFAERRAAREAIMARKPAPDELMALLLRKDLGDEARHQLVGILRNRILTAPRGALGIRMENAAERDGGVRVTGLVPGMPAEKVLKPGDIIRQVNDTVLRNTLDLVNAVQSLPPGVEIRVVVKRVRADALAEKGPAKPPVKPPVKGGAPADPPLDAPPGPPADIHEEIATSMRLGSTEELQEKGEPLAGGNIRGIGGVIVGGAARQDYCIDAFHRLRRIEQSGLARTRPATAHVHARHHGGVEQHHGSAGAELGVAGMADPQAGYIGDEIACLHV